MPVVWRIEIKRCELKFSARLGTIFDTCFFLFLHFFLSFCLMKKDEDRGSRENCLEARNVGQKSKLYQSHFSHFFFRKLSVGCDV